MKYTQTYLQLWLMFVLAFLYVGCQQEEKKVEVVTEEKAPVIEKTETPTPTQVYYEIIDSPEQTFGYDIFVQGQKMIHQPYIPGVQGAKGFSTKADAERVAKLVITKIQRGEMPPTVSLEELEKLHIALPQFK
ncbi:MAG: DUF4907 domain-containing protein [Bacteroidia bacterium]